MNVHAAGYHTVPLMWHGDHWALLALDVYHEVWPDPCGDLLLCMHMFGVDLIKLSTNQSIPAAMLLSTRQHSRWPPQMQSRLDAGLPPFELMTIHPAVHAQVARLSIFVQLASSSSGSSLRQEEQRMRYGRYCGALFICSTAQVNGMQSTVLQPPSTVQVDPCRL